MNPKQKAAYLIVKYMSKVVSKRVAIECALVAVDEMINLDYDSLEYYGNLNSKEYWQEVKEEIQKA
jgi:hypothetical protein